MIIILMQAFILSFQFHNNNCFNFLSRFTPQEQTVKHVKMDGSDHQDYSLMIPVLVFHVIAHLQAQQGHVKKIISMERYI